MKKRERVTLSKKAMSVLVAGALVLSMMPGISAIPSFAYASTNPNDNIVEASEEEQYGGRLKDAAEVEEELETSEIISAVDTSGVESDSISSEKEAELSQEGALPSKYDLRDTGVVSDVKSQAPFGDCWTFGTNTAFEISLNSALGNTTKDSLVELATKQTAWFAYTPLSSDASTLKGTAKSQAGEGASAVLNIGRMNPGGSANYQPASMWMQGIGVSNLKDIPYETKQGTRYWEYDYTTKTEKGDDWSMTDEERSYQIARLAKQNILGSLQVLDSNGNFSHTDENVVNAIKSELVSGRGVMISYQSETYIPGVIGGWTYLNPTTFAQYNDKTKDNEGLNPNHSVCVVGYDDNYSRTNFNEGHQPEKDGAFIVKNSWGGNQSEGMDYADGWGVDGTGYFYISYWDHAVTEASSYVPDLELYNNGENIDTDKEIVDQYDYLQVSKIYDQAASSNNNEGWYANMYTASENQSIHHIGTYYANAGNELKYKIYKLKDDAKSPSDYASSTPVAQGTYTDAYEGYVSIKLSEAVTLKKGEKYAVCFSQQRDDGKYSFPRGYQFSWHWKMVGFYGNTVVNEGESFQSFDSNNSWVSVTDNTASGGSTVIDNYCVKAYATVLDDYTPETYTVTFQNGGSASGDISHDSLVQLYGADKVVKDVYQQKVFDMNSRAWKEVERTRYKVTVEEGQEIKLPDVITTSETKKLVAYMDYGTFTAWRLDETKLASKDITLQALWS